MYWFGGTALADDYNGIAENSAICQVSSGTTNPWPLVKSWATSLALPTTYHDLGIIAQEQRDFAQAEQWYRKSLAISERGE